MVMSSILLRTMECWWIAMFETCKANRLALIPSPLVLMSYCCVDGSYYSLGLWGSLTDYLFHWASAYQLCWNRNRLA